MQPILRAIRSHPRSIIRVVFALLLLLSLEKVRRAAVTPHSPLVTPEPKPPATGAPPAREAG